MIGACWSLGLMITMHSMLWRWNLRAHWKSESRTVSSIKYWGSNEPHSLPYRSGDYQVATALWCRKYFLPMTPAFRKVRANMRNLNHCYWCEHEFVDGEMMALACFVGMGNRTLCHTCTDQLLANENSSRQSANIGNGGDSCSDAKPPENVSAAMASGKP